VLLTTTPLPVSGSGVIDQDVTHGLRCNAKKVSAILPLVRGEASQADVRFVD
jgi:hypothetical protein